MKKFLALILSLAMVFALVACGGEKTDDSQNNDGDSSSPVAITLATGGTSGTYYAVGGVLKTVLDSKLTLSTLNVESTGASVANVNMITDGEAQMAILQSDVINYAHEGTNSFDGAPETNALWVAGIYNETVQILAKPGINTVSDLKGKTIYSTGHGSTPYYALNLVLEKNGLTVGEDVTVVYKTDNSEIAPLLASGEAQVALLPQPFVTSVMGQNETLRVALDMTEEWDKATDGASGLTMGCVVVRTEFAQQNKEALDLFLDEYERSVQTVTSAEGLEHAAQLAEQYNIVKAPVARNAIPACNIVFVQGEQMQQIAGGFLEVLYQANPKSVGGKLPDANFYYNR